MRQKKIRRVGKHPNLIYILPVMILLTILAIVIVAAVYSGKGSSAEDNTGEPDTQATEELLLAAPEEIVSYNGRQYRYNSNIHTYLYMGIDKNGVVEDAADGISGGQSDALFLLVVDEKQKQLSVISVNRNTMTDVDIYDEEGDYVTTQTAQICLQHGYGDGRRTSCLRTQKATAHLFHELPIEGYLSMQMDAMPKLNDAVGGVTLEVLEDLTSSARNVELHKGETVTLNGDEAYVYCRSRDVDVFNSATDRLERQQQYMSAFFSQAKKAVGQDTEAITDIWESVEDYIVTNIDFIELAEDTLKCSYDSSRMYTVPGEMIMGTGFEEYYVDEDAFYEMLLAIFYEPVE